MKSNLNFPLKSIKTITTSLMIVLFLTVLSITFLRCKEESLAPPNNVERSITFRDGEGDPSTDDLLELVGTACVPGSIEIGEGCNDEEFTDTVVVNLPAYTSCTFTIVYHYYYCSTGIETDYTMGDFQILTYNCPSFSSALVSAMTAGGSTLTTFVENFELAIYNQLQAQIIA